MTQVLTIAAGEWRYWLRSHLALSGAILFIALMIVASLLTVFRVEAESHARAQQQTEAEETFLAQPDRHPHRMVHYGHYVFRSPTPLALFDPGLDSVTGQSIFLEGHRQNTAMFAESGASANLGGLAWLNPALIYQLFAPLVLILLGHSSIVRERETAVLAPLLALGIKSRTLVFGKALALLSCTGFLLIPLLISGLIAIVLGASILAVLALLGVYLSYLMTWAMMALLVSVLLPKRSVVLATLTALWLGITLALPSIAVNVAAHSAPLAGKIETDLAMIEDIRKLGDGHNAKDPAFQQLRTDLLKKYGVERVEDLPINFRGIVAMNAEEKLTKVLNEYASARMADEAQQSKLLADHGWLTPTLAIAFASRAISGTDLEHYHRFLRAAEAVRFKFVQGLNRSHADKLSYQDDINRNKNEESWRRARVDAANWQVLDTFQFQPTNVSGRLANASSSIWMLLVWLVVVSSSLFWLSGRVQQ